jgi:hypothetical protein
MELDDNPLDPETEAAGQAVAEELTAIWRAVEAALDPALYARLLAAVRWQVDAAYALGRAVERSRRRLAGE